MPTYNRIHYLHEAGPYTHVAPETRQKRTRLACRELLRAPHQPLELRSIVARHARLTRSHLHLSPNGFFCFGWAVKYVQAPL